MSVQNNLLNKSFVASADYSAKQYYIMKQTTSTTPYGIVLASAATDNVIGILQNEPNVGETGVVAIIGTAKVIAGTPISIGEFIVADSNGKANTIQAAGEIVIGQALEEATAAGDIIEVLITHFTAHSTTP